MPENVEELAWKGFGALHDFPKGGNHAIRRFSGDPVRHGFLVSRFKRGYRGRQPPLFFYYHLNMLFNDALVKISNFCNLHYRALYLLCKE